MTLHQYKHSLAMSNTQLAKVLGVTDRTIRRWLGKKTTPPDYVYLALENLLARKQS